MGTQQNVAVRCPQQEQHKTCQYLFFALLFSSRRRHPELHNSFIIYALFKYPRIIKTYVLHHLFFSSIHHAFPT